VQFIPTQIKFLATPLALELMLFTSFSAKGVEGTPKQSAEITVDKNVQ